MFRLNAPFEEGLYSHCFPFSSDNLSNNLKGNIQEILIYNTISREVNNCCLKLAAF